jgi:hypothetical protein
MGIILGSTTGTIYEPYVHVLLAGRVQMDDDPLDTVYSYVERAYVRLQAGDLLIRCMEDESALPIHNLVEGLVLAGPSSINALREILAEATRRKAQVQDDLHQLIKDLDHSLRGYGFRLSGELREMAFLSLSPVAVLALMREQNITNHETQTSCLRLLNDSRELVEGLISRLVLLDEIELYLQDWIWGVAYQSARNPASKDESSSSGPVS